MKRPTVIETLYSECSGYIDLRALKKDKKTEQRMVRLGDWSEFKAFIHEFRSYELYFGVATRDGKAGKKENIIHIPAVFIDQDFKTIPGEEQGAAKILSEFPLQPTILIKSGGGNHLYWKLKEPAGQEDIEKCEAIMKGLASRLHGDMNATDASRILRIPNTLNHKYLPPRKVTLQHCNGTEFSLSDFDDFLDYDPEISKVHLPSSEQNMALVRIMGCKFMAHCRDDAESLPEPEWRAMITQLMKEKGGRTLIHVLSKPYKGYKKADTDKKINLAQDTGGPQSCDFIKAMWDCGLDCGVKSPAALAYRLTVTHLNESVTNVTDVTSVTDDLFVTGCHRDVTENVTRMSPNPQRIIENQAANVRDWLETCDGVFSIEELAREMQCIRSTSAYTTLKQILKRLVEKQVLERVGEKRGFYRKVENTLEEMEWWEAEDEEFPVTLPIGLTDLVRIYPKNIIVLAGENNAAKTLFSLYVARDNADHIPIRFFNSETDKVELKNRLFSFDDTPVSHWRKVHFYPRSLNFHDVIFPDDINIIDYMEISEDYYKVGGWIRKIFDKLRNGIALINLQKKSGQDMGRGGEVTAEKARLYISLTKMVDPLNRPYTQAKIIKCKAARDFRNNPWNWVRDFRIHRGWQIEPLTEWGPEKKEK